LLASTIIPAVPFSLFAPSEQSSAVRTEQFLGGDSAEWGMLSIKAYFPHVKDQFTYEEQGERRITLKMFLLLYNMRARMVGINQIRNTYSGTLTATRT